MKTVKAILNDIHSTEAVKGNMKEVTSISYSRGMQLVDRELIIDRRTKLQGVTEAEKKVFEFLKKNNVEVLIGKLAGCPMFLNCTNGFHAVMVDTGSAVEGKAAFREAALFHEVGHYLDFKFNFDGDYMKFHEDKIVHGDIYCEIAAWEYGEILARELGYKEWEYFDSLKEEALLSYTYENEDELKRYLDMTDEIMKTRGEL